MKKFMNYITKVLFLNFSNPILSDNNTFIEKKQNPKRLQRKIQKETNTKGIGTKAQIAIKLQHEQCKIDIRKNPKNKKNRKSKENLI